MDPILTTLADLTVGNYLTAALVGITFWYAWQTRQTVQAMRDQNERLTRPYVTVQPVRDNMDFLLQVKNSGRTAAKNLSLEVDQEFHRFGDEDLILSDVGLFAEEIDTFAPGAEVYYKLGLTSQFADEDFQAVMPKRFTVTVRYSYGEKEVTEEVGVNLNQYSHDFLVRKGLRKEILKLRREVEETKKLLSEHLS